MNERAKGITRLVVAVILFINGILTAKGINPIPFDESAFTEILTQLLSGASVLWVWWKNNNITPESAVAQGLLQELKNGGMDKANQEAE